MGGQVQIIRVLVNIYNKCGALLMFPATSTTVLVPVTQNLTWTSHKCYHSNNIMELLLMEKLANCRFANHKTPTVNRFGH